MMPHLMMVLFNDKFSGPNGGHKSWTTCTAFIFYNSDAPKFNIWINNIQSF